MVKWGPVIVGFTLAVILANLFGNFVNNYWGVNLGLFIAGFIVGYWVHVGILGGLWNATVAGSFGSSISYITDYWGNHIWCSRHSNRFNLGISYR
jgi:Family of unknown function (DUF5518)